MMFHQPRHGISSMDQPPAVPSADDGPDLGDAVIRKAYIFCACINVCFTCHIL